MDSRCEDKSSAQHGIPGQRNTKSQNYGDDNNSIYVSDNCSATSRSPSPEPASFLGELPKPVVSFFDKVSLGRFPAPTEKKVQPWRDLWHGPTEPTSDGKLLVACPKVLVYGSNNLGGL